MTDRVPGTPALSLVLLTRGDCCLCDEMKAVVTPIAAEYGASVALRDVDADPELRGQFSDQVPVLFINGRKAFKYRVSATALRRRIGRETKPLWRSVFARLR